MTDTLLVRPESITSRYVSDGAGFAGLIREWAEAFLPLCGAPLGSFPISGNVFRKDNGVDGLIDAAGFIDPLGILGPKTVMQFKANETKPGEAARELRKQRPVGEDSIRERIEQGFKLVWVMVGDPDTPTLDAFRKILCECRDEINLNAPDPQVIDASQLARYLSLTPRIAAKIMGAPVLPSAVAAILDNPPHAGFRFKELPFFAELCKQIEAFVASGDREDRVRRLGGNTGSGRTRTLLEAIQRVVVLRWSACYFDNVTDARRYLNIARDNQLVALVVVDAPGTIGGGASDIVEDDVPYGCKVIVLVSVETQRGRTPAVRLPFAAPTESEVVSVLEANRGGISRRIPWHIARLVGGNLTFARDLLRWIKRDPQGDLTEDAFGEKIRQRLEADASVRDVLRRLALVRYLPDTRLAEFCELVGIDPLQFEEACSRAGKTTGFVVRKPGVRFLASPALAYAAIKRFWEDDKEGLERVLSRGGGFAELIFDRLASFPAGTVKDEIMRPYRPSRTVNSLDDLRDPILRTAFLRFVEYQPQRYLPQLERTLTNERDEVSSERLKDVGLDPYSLARLLQSVGQFSSEFERAERMLYRMARESGAGRQGNDAARRWEHWFHPIFDFTDYPYEARLDLLAGRIEQGDERDLSLAASALASPFPQSSTDIPKTSVGGRLATGGDGGDYGAKLAVAAQRIPELLLRLLESGSDEVREAIAKGLKDGRFRWLEAFGDAYPLARVLRSSQFPQAVLRSVLVDSKSFVALPKRSDSDEPRVAWMRRLHQNLLDSVDLNDVLLDAEALFQRSLWSFKDASELRKEGRILLRKAQADPALLKSLMVLPIGRRSDGAFLFGRKVARWCDRGFFFEALEEGSGSREVAPQLQGLLRWGVKRHPGLADEIESYVRQKESEFPAWSFKVRDCLGPSFVVRAASRMLANDQVGADGARSVLSNLWGCPDRDVEELVGILRTKLAAGVEGVADLALELAHSLLLSEWPLDRLFELARDSFFAASERTSNGNEDEWESVGVRLLERIPKQIIRHAAALNQSLYASATHLLTIAATDYGPLVLDALKPQLIDKIPGRWLFHGDVTQVFLAVPVEEFRAWLTANDNEVAEGIAEQLVQPYLTEDGCNVVDEHTMIFWDRHPPGSPDYDRLMDSFLLRSFSYIGDGTREAKARIEVARRFVNHTSPAIRDWAERWELTSEQLLSRLEGESGLYDAERET